MWRPGSIDNALLAALCANIKFRISFLFSPFYTHTHILGAIEFERKFKLDSFMVLFDPPLFCPSIEKRCCWAGPQISVGNVPLLSSRPPSSVFGVIHDLAAAAAVVAM